LSVAHQAAESGRLLPSFNQWMLTDSDGDTVAHVAARMRNLPKNFSRWELTDKYGTTVAQLAQTFDSLPDGFNQWDLIRPAECTSPAQTSPQADPTKPVDSPLPDLNKLPPEKKQELIQGLAKMMSMQPVAPRRRMR
jgi:hypothetical protein